MTAIYISLTVEFHYEPEISTKKSDCSPLRRYSRKIALFTNQLYISDVYHIFLNRRYVKANENQCYV